MIEGIFGFESKYKFLSNFYPAKVIYQGFEYPTVEHAYQAAKTLDLVEQEAIRNKHFPGQAKQAGRHVKLREDWESIKVEVMEDLLRQKFSDPSLRSKLIATQDLYLEETNSWKDTFWGVCNGKGKNILGLLLMKIRSDLGV